MNAFALWPFKAVLVLLGVAGLTLRDPVMWFLCASASEQEVMA